MKSERRHELQHNDLAEWSIRTYESILPYRLSILGVALLLVVGIVAWQIWHGHSVNQANDAWNAVEIPQAIVQFPAAQMSPVYAFPAYAGEMAKQSEAYPGTPAGDWAGVLTADSCLFLGQVQIVGGRDAALKYLEEAGNRYQKSLTTSAGPLANERAMFGKARILETAGKLPEATAAYQELNKEFPQGTYKAIADQRIEQLGKPEAAELYKAIAEFKPKPKKEAEKKEAEKSAAGPGGKAESMKLPDNPDVPPIAAPVRPDASGSGTAPSAPKSSGSGAAPSIIDTLTKPETPKSTSAAPDLPIGPALPVGPAPSAAPPAKK
jgi:hypothetical protein